MKTVIIKEYVQYQQQEVLELYKSVGWSAYYDRPDRLSRAFANSLCTLAAYDGELLVGLIRTVGDGVSIVFIQDILVRPAYQRQGIGTKLLAQIFSRYAQVRQMHLLTDDSPDTVGFYKAVGLTPVEAVHCRAFTRIHS